MSMLGDSIMDDVIHELAVLLERAGNTRRDDRQADDDVQEDFDHAGLLLAVLGG